MSNVRNGPLKKTNQSHYLNFKSHDVDGREKNPLIAAKITKEKIQLGIESHIIQLPTKNDNGHKNIIKIYKTCSRAVLFPYMYVYSEQNVLCS